MNDSETNNRHPHRHDRSQRCFVMCRMGDCEGDGGKEMSDLISRQAAMDEMSKQQTYKMFVGEDTVYLDANDVGSVLASLPSIDAVPQWILCSERLPEEGIVVVTVDKDGDYEINAIIDEEDCEWFWEKPVAWMPLPKPYERKES